VNVYVGRKLDVDDVVDHLTQLFTKREAPDFACSITRFDFPFASDKPCSNPKPLRR
jgi:hypothetical protein